MRNIEVGDLVYWTLDPVGRDRRKPLHECGEPWIGIVTKEARMCSGFEVFWFNNQLFKTMDADGLILASNSGVKEFKNN